ACLAAGRYRPAHKKTDSPAAMDGVAGPMPQLQFTKIQLASLLGRRPTLETRKLDDNHSSRL
ncbi:hypothetical protein, partial [Pseudomonas sp.]|uniref:hypothetical protein n=1 Tax=Pseudomonas sp. TaxID=306 RepID=UPI0028A8D491